MTNSINTLPVVDTKQWPWPLSLRSWIHPEALGWMSLIVAVIASSTYAPFGRKLTTVFSPLSILAMSESMTILFVLLSFGLLPLLRELLNLHRRELPPLLSVGMFSGVVGPMLWFTGLSMTEAANAELFGRSEELFLVLGAVLFLHESFSRSHLWGGAAIALGVLIVALRGLDQELTLHPGDLFILLGSCSFAIGSTIFKMRLHETRPELVMFVRSLSALGVFFLLSPFIAHPFVEELSKLDSSLLPALLGFGFISRFVNVFSFYEALERLPISTISFVLPLSIVGSIAFAAIYLGEAIQWYHILGGGLVLSGSLLMHWQRFHHPERHLLRHLLFHHRHHH